MYFHFGGPCSVYFKAARHTQNSVFRYLYAQGWLINITPAAESNHNFLNILKLSIASLGVLFLIKHLPKIAKETELTAAG